MSTRPPSPIQGRELLSPPLNPGGLVNTPPPPPPTPKQQNPVLSNPGQAIQTAKGECSFTESSLHVFAPFLS